MQLRFDVITLFPEMFSAVSSYGITGRAVDRGLVTIAPMNLRDFAPDAHKTIDDRPYGGGPGMVMTPGPLAQAVNAIGKLQLKHCGEKGSVVLFSPAGRPVDQPLVDRIAAGGPWTFVCGRYEGVDQRFIDQYVDQVWSLGDFVLSGGEIPAMALMDAAIRRLPGALGDNESSEQDSFSQGLLDWPHYTRPEVFGGQTVPDVLLSGHHERISGFRREAALAQTFWVRPDLIEKARREGRLSAKDELTLQQLAVTAPQDLSR
jgi:tRNA (guanine37-N1)-methyltransferase